MTEEELKDLYDSGTPVEETPPPKPQSHEQGLLEKARAMGLGDKMAAASAGSTSGLSVYPAAAAGWLRDMVQTNLPAGKAWDENLANARNVFGSAEKNEPVATFLGSLLMPNPAGKVGPLTKSAGPVTKALTQVAANGLQSAAQSVISDKALTGDVDGKRALLSGGLSSLISSVPAAASPLLKYYQAKKAEEILNKATNAADDKIASNMGKFDETIKNHFYTPAEKVQELAGIDGTVPHGLLKQAEQVTETKLGNGADEFARNMDAFGGLPQRPVPPRAQMIANEVSTLEDKSKLLPKVKNEFDRWTKSEGLVPGSYRVMRDHFSDPASQKRLAGWLETLSDASSTQGVPRAANAVREVAASKSPTRLTPEQVSEILAMYDSVKDTQQ